MALLFRDFEDGQLGIVTVETAGYSLDDSEFWVCTESGVSVSFRHVLKYQADDYLRTLASGFLDLSGTSYLGEVDYG